MIIGIPKEIKNQENRVALLPDAVRVLVKLGHRVLVQQGAGRGSGYSDSLYRQAGATLLAHAAAIYRRADLVIKVKEPQTAEFKFFRPGLRLFCFFHLAANSDLQRALLRAKVTALAFETLRVGQSIPLLKPMSEIAGRLSIIVGAHYLQSQHGGKGVLLSPTDFSAGASVVIVGAGNVGRAAAEVASGLGAKVSVFDRYPKFSPQMLAKALRHADLVVGAVHIPGARTPQVIRREMVQGMSPGSVLVDVAVDQGGCAETTRATSHSSPTYRRYGVIHYAVPNMPALVSRTASQVLSKTLLPFVKKLQRCRVTPIY